MTRVDAHAFWITGPGQGEIRPEMLPAPGPRELLIETLFTGISRGTEALVFRGQVPVSEYQRMRAPHQSGDFPFPVKYGYCNVGRVVVGPSDLVGRFVFCLYPHQTHFTVPANAVFPLPSAVPPERAVLAPNMETSLNALWDARPLLGDRIAVIGAGAVGCLVSYLAARIPGTRVTLIDIDPGKGEHAARWGAAFATAERAPSDQDLVIHASGSADGLSTALRLVRPEGKVLELSWFGDRKVELPLGEAFHAGRLTLQSSQVGRVSPNKNGCSHQRRLQLALDLLSDPVLDGLITGESSFWDLPRVMTELATRSPGVVCHRIRY